MDYFFYMFQKAFVHLHFVIQLIYLIKLILKEKSDAKILIVAPTSLIYNWSQEFSKFGSEINYKVFAESKEKRKRFPRSHLSRSPRRSHQR